LRLGGIFGKFGAMTITLEQIRSLLAGYRPRPSDDASLRRAAVLIPLFFKNDALHLLLTRRTKSVEHHKGQIAFPGGAADEHDADSIATALRETEEELGLPRSAVEVLGVLDDYTTPSRYSITPVVGFLSAVPVFTPSSHEVAEVFDVPLEFFSDAQNEHIIPVKRGGHWREVYFYNYGEYEVWGVTAGIIRSFLQALRRTPETNAGR
jgi:8-oxo-dGTP pyrophosphatase MutT (NUDIX family)